jgi:hypothetical protein
MSIEALAVNEIRSGVPEHEYHADTTSLSHSGAKLLLRPSVPAKFWEWLTGPQEPPTDAMEFGSVTHTLVLGAGAEYAILDPDVHGLKADGSPADKPTSTKMWKETEADARAGHRIPIHIDDFGRAQAMAEAVRQHPLAAPLLSSPGKVEQSFYATDPVTGVALRGRTDRITSEDGRDLIVDYKTALSANENDFAHTAFKYRYYLQWAWYITLAELCGLSDDAGFVFIVQEKKRPYLVNVIELDDDALDLGRRHMREAIDTYARCMESGVWPGYDEVRHKVGLPLYAFPEQEIVI